MWRVFGDERFADTANFIGSIIPRDRPVCQDDLLQAGSGFEVYLLRGWQQHFKVFADMFTFTTNNVDNCAKIYGFFRNKKLAKDTKIGPLFCGSFQCERCGPFNSSAIFVNIGERLINLNEIYIGYYKADTDIELDNMTSRIKDRAKRLKADYIRIKRSHNELFLVSDTNLSGAKALFQSNVDLFAALQFLACALIVPGIARKGISTSRTWQIERHSNYRRIIAARKGILEAAIEQIEGAEEILMPADYDNVLTETVADLLAGIHPPR